MNTAVGQILKEKYGWDSKSVGPNLEIYSNDKKIFTVKPVLIARCTTGEEIIKTIVNSIRRNEPKK